MLHQIGAGALGPVFRAYQPEPGRLVAVKLFRLDLPPENAHKLVAEFERLIAADLSHPAIAAPIGTGLSDVTPYLAQDFVTADSLDVVIRDGGSSSPSEVARVAAQFGAALDFAAERDVVHGSLHPRDVMLSADDVRITGFGITRAVEQVQISAPVRRPYSAPERAVGGPWDGRADMFSFAALMFELLFGRRVSGAGDRAVTSLPEVPGTNRTALKRVFAKALSGDPGGRFMSGAAFADALQAALVPPVNVAIPSLTDGAAEIGVRSARRARPRVAKKDTADAEASRLDAHEFERGHADPQLPLGDAGLDVATDFNGEQADASPANDLPLADAVDIERDDLELDSRSAASAAAEQQAEEHAPHIARRGRTRAPVQEDPASVVVPPLDSASLDEHNLARPELAATLTPIVDADAPAPRIAAAALDFAEPEAAMEHPADLSMRHPVVSDLEYAASAAIDDQQAGEAAASGLEHGIASTKKAYSHPVGHAELPTSDVAADHGDSLELRPSAMSRETDADHALHAEEREARTGVAGFSQALESTRSALWPIVLAFVVGGAVIAGVLVLVMTRDARQAPDGDVAADAGPAPTAIADEPPIVPSDSSPAGDAPARNVPLPPPPEGTAAPPPVVSEPSASAPRNAAAPTRPPPTPERPRPATGRLVVRSTPAGARVTIDGRTAGVTPLTLPNVNLGAHAVRLQRDGYAAAERRVSTTAERPNATLNFELARTPAPRAAQTTTRPPARTTAAPSPPAVTGPTTLVVESRPGGATVTLNGRAVGTTPLTLTGVAVGEFPLTIDLAGFRRWTTSVKIENGQRTRVGASLEQ